MQGPIEKQGELRYRSVSINSGNKTPGDEASAGITRIIKDENLDFFVLNCQEINYKSTITELQRLLPEGYTIQLVGSMNTKTKRNTLLGGTGMASFVIHRNDVTVDVKSSIEARRNPYALGGTSSNKGGLVTDCTIQKEGSEPIHVKMVSAHLDSNLKYERAKDWGVVHKQIAKTKIENFDQLVEAIPNIQIAGYDANTRNLLVDRQVVNPWESDAFETEGLKQVVFGGTRFSGDSTYKSNDQGIANRAATGKRSGNTEGGMLDFTDIMDGTPTKNKNEIIRVDVIDPEVGAKGKIKGRDHAVVPSNTMGYSKPTDDFIKVRNHMAAMLEHTAPDLADGIRELPNTPESKEELIDIYNTFLSKKGLLLKEYHLFMNKLGVVQKAEELAKKNPELKQSITNIRTSTPLPWFKGVTLDNYKDQIKTIKERQKEGYKTINNERPKVNAIGRRQFLIDCKDRTMSIMRFKQSINTSWDGDDSVVIKKPKSTTVLAICSTAINEINSVISNTIQPILNRIEACQKVIQNAIQQINQLMPEDILLELSTALLQKVNTLLSTLKEYFTATSSANLEDRLSQEESIVQRFISSVTSLLTVFKTQTDVNALPTPAEDQEIKNDESHGLQ